jgi:MFS family permease
MQIMVLFGFGALVSSLLLGLLCDRFSIRRLAYLMLAYTIVTLSLLYLAIAIKYFYTTLLLYFFLGTTAGALLAWSLSACSKLYQGKFEAYAVNFQWIGISYSLYELSVVFVGPAIKVQTRLSLELAILIVQAGLAIFFARRLPDGSEVIEFE